MKNILVLEGLKQKNMLTTIVRRTADISAICIIAISFILCGKRTVTEDISNGLMGRDTSLLSKDDANFVRYAAALNTEELKLGKLGETNATMPEVKDMARIMENDYANILNQLKDLANRKLLTLPEDMNSDGKDAYEKLMNRTGSDFDKEFTGTLVNIDKNAIDTFEKEMKSTRDTDIKDWAATVISVYKTHLEKAQKCLQKGSKPTVQ